MGAGCGSPSVSDVDPSAPEISCEPQRIDLRIWHGTLQPEVRKQLESGRPVLQQIDCIPAPKSGNRLTLYSSMSLVSDDQTANIHGIDKRVVTPESGQFHYYRFGNGAEDILVFMEVLTKECVGNR